MARVLQAIAKMDAHHRLLLGFLVAAVVGLALRTHALLWTASLAAYDAFAFAILGLIWVTVTLTPREQIRAVAQRQDVGRTVIFIFVIIVACAALFAVAFLIRSGKPERHFSIHLLLALTTVVLSWLLMHAVFGLRYAHKFYDDSVAGAGKHAGGLNFPEDDLPDYRDFAYFSFVIGMTCQVSDVSVTSREMRRLVLVHGILSFGFNTAILALTINTVSSFL